MSTPAPTSATAMSASPQVAQAPPRRRICALAHPASGAGSVPGIAQRYTGRRAARGVAARARAGSGLADEPLPRVARGLDHVPDDGAVDVGDDDLPHLVVRALEDAEPLQALALAV